MFLSSSTEHSSTRIALLALLLLAGVALRAPGLGKNELSYDEAYSVWVARDLGRLAAELEKDSGPPGYYGLSSTDG